MQIPVLGPTDPRATVNAFGGDFCIWHEPDMPQQSLYVRCRGQNGRHLLLASISPFDPTETSGLIAS
jgi:hypothetical protein